MKATRKDRTMLQREFFKNVMESNLTEETIAYAKERYEKMIEKDREKASERNSIRNDILGVLTPHEKLTARAVAEHLGVSVQKASYHLYTLAHEGLIAQYVEVGGRSPKEYSALPE